MVMEMLASAASTLAMVACPMHHPLTLLHLTLLLRLKHKTIKKEKKTRSEASWRPPPSLFGCLMTKGEEVWLKLEGSTHFVFCFALSGKTGLSGFAQQNFYLSFSFPNSSELENYVMCERLC
jgi:hypothetical protein